MAELWQPHSTVGADAYAVRLATEKSAYQDCVNVHNLPDIFHYWSNRYLRPQLEAFGFGSPEEMFGKFVTAHCREDKRGDRKRLVSLGSGNCQLEIDLACQLHSAKYGDFTIDCLDINPAMLERGRAAAAKRGVADRMNFIQADLNHWDPAHPYDVAIANQTLHHVANLEGLFRGIKRCLHPDGRFVISELIGRNGHQRWPEALAIVQEFWRKLPPAYRFNRQLGRYEERFGDWDCSGEGFEGIRAQDILPLLIEHFHFEFFIAYANAIDVFVDRSFGFNFDAAADWDRRFIDQVHARDESEILAGRISPTHMLAVVGNDGAAALKCREPLTPGFCLRDPTRVAMAAPGLDAYDWNAWPHDNRTQLEFVCGQLNNCERMLKEAETAAEERTAWARRLDVEVKESAAKIAELHEELIARTAWVRRLEKELEERTAWAVQLEQESEKRGAWGRRLENELKEQTARALQLERENARRAVWGLQLEKELEERTAWAFQLDRENRELTGRGVELTAKLDRLGWALALDRRGHRFLDGVFRLVRRILRAR